MLVWAKAWTHTNREALADAARPLARLTTWRPWNVRAVHVLLAATALTFLVTWLRVLLGTHSLVGLDMLYRWPPWAFTDGAHEARNTILFDPVQQMYPWFLLTREALLNGRLPLWDSLALSGRPLLANDISAVLSPFTLIALPFAPLTGMSLGMLAKMWVAGVGMAVFLRTLKCSGLPAAIGGIAFATCSFVALWLAWPQSNVAAFLPWAFAGVEGFISQRLRRFLVIFAVSLALQFLGGHAETSLHLGVALALYSAIRIAGPSRQWWRLVRDLALAGIVGSLLAGIQLVPFFDYLSQATILEDRSSDGISAKRIEPVELDSWLVPNGRGSPAIDGILDGRLPNFNEATGFVGIGVLLLAPLGGWWAWQRDRRVGAALVALLVVSAGIVYGPLIIIASHTPGLALSANRRFLLVVCFALVALGALGVEQLVRRGRTDKGGDIAGWASLFLAYGAIAGLLAGRLALARSGAEVDAMLPSVFGLIGFWVLVAALSIVAAISFALVGLFFGRGSASAFGFGMLALAEASLFAGPFNPRVPLSESPPPSVVVDWLRANAADATIVGLETILAAETLTIYGLRDARGEDALLSPRLREFWAKVDPKSDRDVLFTLRRPDARWLAAAGISYVVAWGDNVLPGTTPVLEAEGVTVARVEGTRPFVFVAPNPIFVRTMEEALERLAPDDVVIEWMDGNPPLASDRPASQASVAVVSRLEEAVDLDVSADQSVTIVILQSYFSGWEATVDGVPTSIRPANLLFQAITVPAGPHRVSLRYRPASIWLGASFSLVGLIGLLVLARRRVMESLVPEESGPHLQAR